MPVSGHRRKHARVLPRQCLGRALSVGLSDKGKIALAASWLTSADGLLVTAGAGMGVDSGLPDFRSKRGFWRAYPAFEDAGTTFHQIASPAAMRALPTLGWGFYGHRLELYRRTTPHPGFYILREWAARMPRGLFVYTSNVDGQFQKAGYPDERIVECHGSIHYLQCTDLCSRAIWSADELQVFVDSHTCRLLSELPTCPRCGAMARPNILMFDDYEWIDERTERQYAQFERWRERVSKLVVIEIGAGKAVSTVRRFSEKHGPRVIRINTNDYAIAPHVGIGIAGSALETLRAIKALETD